MPVALWLVLCALATARLTGLICLDEVTRPARDWLLRQLDETRPAHQALAYLTSCVHCVSIWVGAVVAVAAWLWGPRPAVALPVTALAFSQVAGMLAGVGRGD